MNKEKRRLQKFLVILDKHILNGLNQDEVEDTRNIGGLFSIRSEIINRLGEITSMERRRRMWDEFRESDYHGEGQD